MKTLRQIVLEVAQPKSDDEKHFKDKHITTKVDHPVAPDHVFTGKVAKAPKRRADYDKGEDESVYESSFDVPTAEGGEHDSEESHKKYKQGNKSPKPVKEAKMDPVNKKAAMGKFKHRADKDIDNDGDVDSSDKYLHARRNAITKAIHKEELDLSDFSIEEWEEFMESAEYEQLDEISKKTLGSYVKKASSDLANNAYKLGARDPLKTPGSWDKAFKRKTGIAKATDRLTKEEAEGLDEISRDTARSYIRKAMAHKTTGETPKKDRSAGVNLAGKKAYGIGGKAKVSATESVEQVDEVLKPTTDMGTWIKDFQKSDAPQFKGKSKEKRRQMAIAAKYGAEREAGMREESDLEEKLIGGQKKLDHNKNGKIDAHDFHLMRKKKMKEEVEQLDELSPNTLHSYIKKAAGNMAGNAAVAAAQASSSMKKSSPDVKRKIKNRMQGITGASGRLADKANMAENAWEEVPMMMRQLQFIMFAAEEIMEYLDTQVDPEEWFQNKLAHIHDQMQTLQAYAEGDMRMMSRMGGMYREEVELDEDITKMSHGRLKFHLNTNTPHGSYNNDELKAERDRRLKTGEGQAYKAAKAGLSEVTQSAVKKAVTFTGSDGKSHTKNVPIKRIDRDEHGQEKIRESVDLDEAFKVGMIKLNDGSSVVLKKEDVDVLNGLFKSLSSTNRKKMESTAMKDKNGFNEILSFAREAL